jgi:hypothetical protein
MKKIIGGVITLVIGGMVFSVTQADIVKNFSKETGLSQSEAQEYVDGVIKDELVSYDKVGAELIDDGKVILKSASEIDCVTYQYSWVSNTLSCLKGKAQLITLGNGEISLGNAYTILSSDNASKKDMTIVIDLIDKNNVNLSLEIVRFMLEPEKIAELRKINSFNKALLISALESKK